GELGDAFYIIIQGSVAIFTTGQSGEELLLAQLKEGEYFGEQALLLGIAQKRRASARADANLILLKISYDDFQKLLSRDALLKKKLIEIGKQQIREKALRQSSLFRAIKPEEMAGDWYREVEFKDSEEVFHEGDAADALYLITAGVAEVYRKEGEGQKLLVKL